MTLQIKQFTGIFPRLPPTLLPERAATVARNCDFAYGELRSTKGPFHINTMQNQPRSIYTDNGLTFYTWPGDVDAVRSPLVSDQHDRLYYTEGGDLKVTRRDGMRVNGGLPGTSYKAGVPKPTVAPNLAQSIAAITAATHTLEWTFHYELAGKKYQEGAIAVTDIGGGSFRFTPPAVGAGAAEGASTVTGLVNSSMVVYVDASISSGTTLGIPLEVYATSTQAASINTYIFQMYLGSYTYYIYYDPPVPYLLNTIAIGYHNSGGESGPYVESNTWYRVGSTKWFSNRQNAAVPNGTVSVGGATTSSSEVTPEGATPVICLKATHKTDGTVVQICSNASTHPVYSVSLVKDVGADTYTVKIDAGVKEEDKEARAYIYTFVNIYNEEGPPSPSAIVSTGVGVTVAMTATMSTVTGYVPLKEIRIYRTPTGSGIADYFYVGAVSVIGTQPGASINFTDNVPPEMLNEPISSTDYYAPPSGLGGLIALPNGILMAWRGNELWFSEAYKPWAWPPKYSKPQTHSIVGALAHGSGAVVTTIANPMLVSGVSPDSMTVSKINISQAGVSKWSIASVDGMVAFASHDGIVTLVGASGSLARSEAFFTREVWRGRYGNALGTMQFSVWDGRLVVFSRTQAFTPFMIRLDEAAGSMTELPDLQAWCAFISPESDQFYYTTGAYLYQFNGGSHQQAEWASREVVLPRPENFGVCQAVVEGNWTVEFYADGVLRKSKQVSAGKITFRLPAGFKSDRWKIRITGSGAFKELKLAKTPNELAAV